MYGCKDVGLNGKQFLLSMLCEEIERYEALVKRMVANLAVRRARESDSRMCGVCTHVGSSQEMEWNDGRT